MIKKTGRRTVMKALGGLAAIGLTSSSASAQSKRQRVSNYDSPERGPLAMPDRHGPMKSNRFTVEFDGEAIPGWQTVELPSISIEQGNYREKEEGSNYETKEWGEELSQELELEMSRAVLKGDSTLWDWRRAVNEESDEARKRVSIKLLDDEGVVEYEERFLAAWPKEYEPPDLDASADDEETADETIRLKFDNVIERKRVQLDDDD